MLVNTQALTAHNPLNQQASDLLNKAIGELMTQSGLSYQQCQRLFSQMITSERKTSPYPAIPGNIINRQESDYISQLFN
jgi:hypothetical protein